MASTSSVLFVKYDRMPDDAVLPCQLSKTSALLSSTPVGSLMVAILEGAINEYLYSSNPNVSREAQTWFFQKTNQRYIFAFETLAHLFGLSPPAVRQALLTLKREVEEARANGTAQKRVVRRIRLVNRKIFHRATVNEPLPKLRKQA